MPGFSLKIVTDTVTPKLIQATPQIKQAIADQLDTAGQEMEAEARNIVPVRTGFLQSTIYHQVNEAGLSVELGATADYAAYVEYGTRWMAAEPYIRPAFDAGQERFLAVILHGILFVFQ